jgi:DNA-directed RNA polymerase subunit RPC12/RpoP
VTVEERVVMELSDIQLLHLECTNCSTTVTFQPDKFQNKAVQCPYCDQWMVVQNTPTMDALARLVASIRYLSGPTPDSKGVRVRLQITPPHRERKPD